ncbi:MAG: hypothetical protein UMR38_03955 [Candidatus Izemoplasma sp.]|nr:hypothetical protein [Candidatus Izemoplasma sp.]
MKKANLETMYLLREPEEFTMTLEQEQVFIKSNQSSKNHYVVGVYECAQAIS